MVFEMHAYLRSGLKSESTFSSTIPFLASISTSGSHKYSCPWLSCLLFHCALLFVFELPTVNELQTRGSHELVKV